MGPAVGAGFGPGAFLPKREPGAEPGRRCRRMEGGGDGKPDSGRPVRRPPPPPPRRPPTRLSSGWARGRQPGPGRARLAGPGRRAPACGAGAGGGRLDRGAPPSPGPPEPWGPGRAARCHSGADRGRGRGVSSVRVNAGVGICGVEFPKEKGFLKTPAWWQLMSLFTFSSTLLLSPTPVFPSRLFCVLQ